MNKKILDFPEAAELANDDYIILDSESGGGCRIKAKKIAPVVVGVEATYTQTQEVTPDTPLNDLKQDLVVKAVYRNNRKKVVTDYTLSGTLSVGTSTVTVTYSGFTTTFEVIVTASTGIIAEWNLASYSNPRIDIKNGYELELGGVYDYYVNPNTGAVGAYFRSDKIQYLKLPSELHFDYSAGYDSLTYELDILYYQTGSAGAYRRVFCLSSNWGGSSDPITGVQSYGYSGNLWKFYIAGTGNDFQNYASSYGVFNEKTLAFKIEKKENGLVDLTLRTYNNEFDLLLYSATNQPKSVIENYQNAITIGSFKNYPEMYVTGFRVITG